MRIKVNDEVKEINEEKFAFDGCHKIYMIEDPQDEKEAISYGYEIHSSKDLRKCYENSCSLRFIDRWKLDGRYVGQFEKVYWL